MQNNQQFDLQLCLYQSSCKRRHLIMNKSYQLFVFQDHLIVGESLIKPKYTMKFDMVNRILWRFNNQGTTVKSFGMPYGKKIKWFDADQSKLLELKFKMGNRVFYGNISFFYDSITVIGSGASCKVCSVVRKTDQMKYAAKCVSKKYLSSKKSNGRLLRLHQEIDILQKLKHKNFVNLLEIYQGENSYYLVTDLYEGDTLYKYLKNNQELNDTQIRTIMRQIFEALEYLNQNGIIHRDIKLENILFENNQDLNTLKIIDLGLAIYESQSMKFSICGTPGYIAPEILKLDEKSDEESIGIYNHKCDIFSAGVILYKLLSKQTLFKGINTTEILNNNKACVVDYNSLQCLQSVSNDALNLLRLLLSQDPNNRPSASSVLEHPYFSAYRQCNRTTSGITYNKDLDPQKSQQKSQLLKLIACNQQDSHSFGEEDRAQDIPVLKSRFLQKQKVIKNYQCCFEKSPSRQRNHFSPQKKGDLTVTPYMPSFSKGCSLQSFESPAKWSKEDIVVEFNEKASQVQILS